MIYLSLDEILAIHQQMIDIGGGSEGLRDIGLLLSALELPKAGVYGVELYPQIEQKAAALLFTLVQNHPFVDGNKRTAYFSTQWFLIKNKKSLNSNEVEIIKLLVDIASGKSSLEDTIKWLSRNIS